MLELLIIILNKIDISRIYTKYHIPLQLNDKMKDNSTSTLLVCIMTYTLHSATL